ncbi:hypothetical protein BDV93DRAFT_552118 [Ceratobasidium sp. AG-I]|nr:hypothetical protein BDV93DRAFT_552118 [Ceratobasidium sp. AG-I]
MRTLTSNGDCCQEANTRDETYKVHLPVLQAAAEHSESPKHLLFIRMNSSTFRTPYPNVVEPPVPYWLLTSANPHPSIETLSQERIISIVICSYPGIGSGVPDNDWHILFVLDNGLGLIELGWEVTTARIPGINTSYVSRTQYENLANAYTPTSADVFEVNKDGPGGVLNYDKLFGIIAQNELDACTLSTGLGREQYHVNWRSWIPTLIGILAQHWFVSPSATSWLAARMKFVWAVDSSGHISPLRRARVQPCPSLTISTNGCPPPALGLFATI